MGGRVGFGLEEDDDDEACVGGDLRLVPDEDDEELLALPLPFLSFDEKTMILGAMLRGLWKSG